MLKEFIRDKALEELRMWEATGSETEAEKSSKDPVDAAQEAARNESSAANAAATKDLPA